MGDKFTRMTAQPDMNFEGTHGTSQRSAANIKLHGFQLSRGRVGEGAYFWAQSMLAEHLARGWFQQQKKKGVYREYPGPLEAVVVACVDCFENEHIDLEDLYFKDKLQQLAAHHNVKNLDSDFEVAKLHAMVIEEIEKHTGVKCRVIEVRLAPPDSTFVPKYSIKMYGAPICYVVREANCITIKQVL